MVTSKKFGLVSLIFSAAFMISCGHGLPMRDTRPEEAKHDGYFVDSTRAENRGGLLNYVPMRCSNGGWGHPTPCTSKAAAAAPAAPVAVAQVSDEDGDGVADHLDQCKGTARGVSVNAFGCVEGSKTEIKLQVQFKSGSAEVAKASAADLDRIATVMKKDEDVKIRVEGHTDSIGNGDTNQKLSEARANAVKELLIQRGVKADQLTSQGYGSSRPVADNKTAPGRQQNRRVVAVLVE